MTPNFLQKIITAHYIWLESNRISGQRADLRCANLSWASLRNVDFQSANLTRTDLRHTDLRKVDFRDTMLIGADLRNADLRGADLRGANLYGINLDHTKGFLKPIKWTNSNFEKNNKGYIVFKRIGEGKTLHSPPDHWVIEEGSYLTETVNEDRRRDCSYGINFGTREWCKNHFLHADLWECLLEFDDLDELVVPYSSDGKARCGRLKLVKIT